MGKRKKSNLQIINTESKITKLDNNTTDEAKILIKSKNKKNKSQRNKVDAEETGFQDSVDNISESNSKTVDPHRNTKKKLKKESKTKNELLHNNESAETVEISPRDESHIYDKKKVKNKKVTANREALETSENSMIADEQRQVVEKEINIQNKVKKSDLEQENDVKDEDIDKFCDEIDEEDNLQYLNWVELIEAKLNSNKKKP